MAYAYAIGNKLLRLLRFSHVGRVYVRSMAYLTRHAICRRRTSRSTIGRRRLWCAFIKTIKDGPISKGCGRYIERTDTDLCPVGELLPTGLIAGGRQVVDRVIAARLLRGSVCSPVNRRIEGPAAALAMSATQCRG